MSRRSDRARARSPRLCAPRHRVGRRGVRRMRRSRRGSSEVRIVHGRGRGVQRGIVQAALERHPLVEEFWDDTAPTWARRCRGVETEPERLKSRPSARACRTSDVRLQAQSLCRPERPAAGLGGQIDAIADLQGTRASASPPETRSRSRRRGRRPSATAPSSSTIFLHGPGRIDEHHVDRKPHPERVHGGAARDDER